MSTRRPRPPAIAPRLSWALAEVVGRDGCPVCALLRQDEAQYWDGFLYEGFQDAAARTAMRAAIGCCRRHQAQLEQRNDDVPGATMAAAAVRGALDRLERPVPRRTWRQRPPARPPGDACPVCLRLVETQSAAVDELIAALDRSPEVAAAFASSSGLCVDHLLIAGPRADLREPTERALAEASKTLERLLESFDYRRDAAGPELVAAWRRAFRLIRDDPGAVEARNG